MTDVIIEGRSKDNAILLIAAAREIGADETLVRTTTSGYIVPEEIAAAAFPTEKAEEKAPAKKAVAKKTTAKKAASKPKGEE